jgi:hypothetical protein
MWTLGVVMAHPSAQDVVELRPAEAEEKIQTFALDSTDEGLGEGIGVWRPVRDLNNPGTFRCPDSIKAGAELGVGVPDQEAWLDPGDEGRVAEGVKSFRIFRLLLLLRMCGKPWELGTSGAVGG